MSVVSICNKIFIKKLQNVSKTYKYLDKVICCTKVSFMSLTKNLKIGSFLSISL